MNISYIDKNGTKIPVRGKVGDNVMYLAHRYGIELEGKTCQNVQEYSHISFCHYFASINFFTYYFSLRELLDQMKQHKDLPNFPL